MPLLRAKGTTDLGVVCTRLDATGKFVHKRCGSLFIRNTFAQVELHCCTSLSNNRIFGNNTMRNLCRLKYNISYKNFSETYLCGVFLAPFGFDVLAAFGFGSCAIVCLFYGQFAPIKTCLWSQMLSCYLWPS